MNSELSIEEELKSYNLNEDAITNFRTALFKANKILVLTGAGVSAESGVPTFRGPGGFWRTFQVTDLATPQAFEKKSITGLGVLSLPKGSNAY